MDDDFTLRIAIDKVAQAYRVELSYSDPRSQAQVAPVRGEVAFDLDVLLELKGAHEDYGKALTRQLLADPEVERRFLEVERAAQASDRFLRILLYIDSSAQELHGLRWELLRHPRSGAVFSTSERVVLSRFMVSHDARPVALRTRTELTAVVAVSAPSIESLQRMKLAPVDYEGEVGRARAALDGIEIRVLGGPGSPLTIDRLLEPLRDGVDILYLVCHGMFGRRTGAPALILQDETGVAQAMKGHDLAVRIEELRERPRLVVLVSCQSAGDGASSVAGLGTTPQATLAGRLAEAGAPAVLAMQGLITMATVEAMMPVLLTELQRDGRIDRALAVARGRIRDHHDWWMPVLYTRLLGGRLWAIEDGVTPTPGSVTARLDAAYSHREELTLAGADTTQIDAEILDLRREQRHGPTLHAGEFLGDGRFRLVEVVGQGGFATVWKAYDKKLRRFVAIKVLHGQFAQVASRRERLFRGARMMADLQHPNVVRVLVPEGEEQGFYYYVMEYVAGGDLYQAIAGKKIDTEQALDVVEKIAGVLEVAHSRGLVHRDVKPQNILLHEDGTPALTDFDLVQTTDTTGGTRTGALGTVIYAAPEQNEDASRVDYRVDIYSLGMTAIFCIYGKRLPQTVMFERSAFLARLRCEVALFVVLQRAVALRSGERFETIARFRVALAAARRGPEQPEQLARKSDAAAEALPDEPMSRAEVSDGRSENKRPWLSRRKVVVGSTVVGGLAVGGLILRVRTDKGEGQEGLADGSMLSSNGSEVGKLPYEPGASTYGVNEERDDQSQDRLNESGEQAKSGGQIIVSSKSGIELVQIPAGSFLMGSSAGVGDDDEHPRHGVELMSFRLAKTPVTNAQYARFLDENPGVFKPAGWSDDLSEWPDHPVTGVSWYDAKEYCEWAGMTLPTEAQWEYACRAGTTTRYYSGDYEDELARVGWYLGNSDFRLHEVGKKEPNAFGLYDMHGNVWEWCLDAFVSYRTAVRPSDGLRGQPVGDANRVLRGGGFNFKARYARSANRNGNRPRLRVRYVGVRPVQAIL
ncbi:MAG: SUMF1/EgtB/PvdO family nonheme iron enzyme [Myxococcota bacterium]